MFYLWLLPVNAQSGPLELVFWARANRWLDYSHWRITTLPDPGQGRETDRIIVSNMSSVCSRYLRTEDIPRPHWPSQCWWRGGTLCRWSAKRPMWGVVLTHSKQLWGIETSYLTVIWSPDKYLTSLSQALIVLSLWVREERDVLYSGRDWHWGPAIIL